MGQDANTHQREAHSAQKHTAVATSLKFSCWNH